MVGWGGVGGELEIHTGMPIPGVSHADLMQRSPFVFRGAVRNPDEMSPLAPLPPYII